MARLPEQRVWDGLKAAKAKWPSVKLERIENATNDGNPDVHGGNRNGVEFWIELKAVSAMPARDSTPVLAKALRASQEAWHKDWSQYGVRVFVLAKVGEVAYLLPALAAATVTKGDFFNHVLACGYRDAVEFLHNLSKGD